VSAFLLPLQRTIPIYGRERNPAAIIGQVLVYGDDIILYADEMKFRTSNR
jgi:hypothetical protein